MGTGGGTAHAVAYQGNHHCNVQGWGPFATTQQVLIVCLNTGGVPADGAFTVLFYKESRAATDWSGGYLWANQSAAASYTPSTSFQWNSKGGSNTVVRTGAGRYTATFPGLGPLPHLGSVMVTGFNTSARCRSTFWSDTTDVTVNVACDSVAGAATDATFTLSFFTDTAFGVNNGQEQRRGAFVWANESATASYVPAVRLQYNSAGAPIRARRTSVGTYTIDIPGLISSSSSTVQVSRYGAGGHCNVNNWGTGPLSGTSVTVRCHNNAGSSEDAQFVLTYLTNQLATAALPAAGGPNRAKAWVYSDGAATNTNPNSNYQFNSAGGVNTVTRTGPGRYRVDFPNLGTTSGIVHVNSYGGSAYCKANTWGPNGTTQEVYVMCFDSNGVTVDNEFTVLFYKEDRPGTAWNAAYARAHLPIVSAAYPPLSTYSWNGNGQAISVSRLSTGSYLVSFSGFQASPNGGTVQVTPYGVTDIRCKVVGWSVTSAQVGCYRRDGTPDDSEFGISYATDVIYGADPGATAHPGGFAWANSSAAASYQPSSIYRHNSTGGGFLATRSGTGAYQMDFEGLKAFGKSVALVTAYGGAGPDVFCRPNSLNWVSP